MNLSWSAFCQSSSVRSRISPPGAAPALLTRTSIRPKRETVASTIRWTSSGRGGSPGAPNPSAPVALASSWAASSSEALLGAQIATRPPSWARPRATALPMPLLPPVTSATCPFKPRSIADAPSSPEDLRRESIRVLYSPPPRPHRSAARSSRKAVTGERSRDGEVSRRHRAAEEPRVLAGRRHRGRAHRLAGRADRDGRRRRQGHLRQLRGPDASRVRADRPDAAARRRHARESRHDDGLHQGASLRRSLRRAPQAEVPGRQLPRERAHHRHQLCSPRHGDRDPGYRRRRGSGLKSGSSQVLSRGSDAGRRGSYRDSYGLWKNRGTNQTDPPYALTAASITVAARNANRGERCGERTVHTRNVSARSGATRILSTERSAHVARGEVVACLPTG